jgi:hypothetical protein
MLSQRRKPSLARALLMAAPVAAWVTGCCKTDKVAIVPPDDMNVAAQRGLERVLGGLGKADPNGKVSTSFRNFARQSGSQPIAGLGLSLDTIIQHSVFTEHGLYTAFNVDAQGKTIGRVASFLNGPTSPLRGWKGWRYRSGLIDVQHEPASFKVEQKLSLPGEASQARAKVDGKQPEMKQTETKQAELKPAPVPQEASEGEDFFDPKDLPSMAGRSIYMVLFEEPIVAEVRR